MNNIQNKGEATSVIPRRPRVVIVGAGFGGIYAAKALRKAPVDVIVIDRNNHHLFQIGFRNRFLVMFQSIWGFITFQRGARLITFEKNTLLPTAREEELEPVRS